ncbi:alpha-L-fucosidase [Paenibacillus sp. GCM10023248]|uniref:alpha-L-fucosidase n=1 Tax=unclassified Paenibacillus TaxID=185978 RepID=UPI00237A0110|nr:alpha-L-fucosidase [Paenibacillus sp. MAHUQ-63]MDD9268243.1 alpha-L-fucosidase [Paenibacillus sp. MAHUQ-63]
MLSNLEMELIGQLTAKGQTADQKLETARRMMDTLTVEQLETSASHINRYQQQLPNPEDTYWFSLQEVKKLMQNEANRRKIAKLGLTYSNGEPAAMSGAELASMLKSNVRFKSTDGIKDEALKLREEDRAWWHDAKLGMFVHWGAYSILGRGEWVMHHEQIPEETYREIAMSLHPQSFDANNWVALAKSAGMHYMVMVSRHHDGFALWDSPGSYRSFTTMQASAGRDFIREYTEAAHRHGIRAGVYYSPMDWRFPGYFDPVEQYDSALRMKQQLYDQVAELMTNYGQIDILWYDGSWLSHKGSDAGGAWLWEPVKLNRMVRSHNPKVVINERSGWEGDFSCDEGPHDIRGGIIPFPWEKNFSVGGSWAWQPGNKAMPFEKVMDLILNVFVRGGNALLNVTPDQDGIVPEDQVQLFKRIGEWMSAHGESIYGTRGGPFQPLDDVYGATYKDNIVYVHILDPEAFERVKLPALDRQVIACQTLSGSAIPFEQDDDGIVIRVPGDVCERIDTIVKLTLNAPVEKILPN